MSNISSKDYVPGILKISSAIASASNKIPQGENYSFVELDPEIQNLTAEVYSKISNILTQVLSFASTDSNSIDYEEVVEASDRCLEHVAITLDNLKNPKKTIPKITNYELQKPVLPRRLDNSLQPFVPFITEKLNFLIPAEESPQSHPYLPELESLCFKSSHLTCEKVIRSQDLCQGVRYIDSSEKLTKMIEELESCSEIAVDLEHHSFRSYFGFTCLMQISTRTEDYIIDPFPIWNDMQKLLNVFTNPMIVKVLHGADSDVLWLQRDFALYIVNMFDTGQAARKLMFSHLGLGYLLEQLCGVSSDKSFQLADWRIRPLTEDHLKYARIDTHYLLEIYDKLKDLLISKAAELKLSPLQYVKDVFTKSKEICMKAYEKPDFTWIGINGAELLDKKQKKTLQKLAKWRDLVARSEDESPSFVISGRKLVSIAAEKPEDLKSLAKVVQNFNFVNKYGEGILKVLSEEEVELAEEKRLTKVFKESVKICENHEKYQMKFKVSFKDNENLTFFQLKKIDSKNSLDLVKENIIKKSLNSVFDSRNSWFFNKHKQIPQEQRTEKKAEEVLVSLQERYEIPFKSKVPATWKPKQSLEKRQKISEKRDIRIGWLDNIELQPVKRKNLFKKK